VSGKWVWYLAAIAGTFIMASLGAFVRQVTPGNEVVIALGRFGIGFACLAAWRALARDRAGERASGAWWARAAAGGSLALFVVSYFKAVQSGTLANAAFLLYLGPLIASTLAALVLEEGFDRTSALLLGCAVLGTLFITEVKLPRGSQQVESLVFGLLSGLFYGLFLLFNNNRLQGDGSSLANTYYQLGIAALVMVPFVIVTGADLRPADLAWIGAIGVLHGFVALTLVIAALQYLKTIEYGTISYGEPVIAALIGALTYHERISALQLVGCVLVFAAGMARIVIATHAPRESERGMGG
jgi:drug/metabolite transporter (DMT)-like permease